MLATRTRRPAVRRRFHRPHRPQRLRPRLVVECLEDRTLLATGLTTAALPLPANLTAVPGQFSTPVAGQRGALTAAQASAVQAEQQNQLAARTNANALTPQNQALL